MLKEYPLTCIQYVENYSHHTDTFAYIDSKNNHACNMQNKFTLNDCDRRTSMEPLEVPSTNFRTPIISFSSSAVITTVPVRPLVVRMNSLTKTKTKWDLSDYASREMLFKYGITV